MMKPSWLHALLVILIIEKIVQHVFVTLAFYFNWLDIASTVAVNPTILMVLGAIVAILFVVSLWGMLTKRMRMLNLAMGLAVFDIVGEFAVQGKICIAVNVSFLVAALLLFLALKYRRAAMEAL